MPRYTATYRDFAERLDEVDLLRKRAAERQRSKDSFRHGAEISALCRGAVVLLSSHVEAYVKELREHTLDALHTKAVCRSNLAPQFFYHVSKESIEPIRNTSQAEQIAEHMQNFIDKEGSYWGRTKPFPAPISSMVFNKGFSNPTFDKVKAYFGRFGYTGFRKDFFRTLGRDAQTTLTNLNGIIETRNSIAHGDPSATKTPNEVREMMTTAKLFCRTTDAIFGTWCRRNLCSIR
ncbi:MAE_28990/MAE_18760 family HEPN-like nuclease [Hoeflea poritis]|uniref:MAE_28990/MAE_18760 family HEPN-like nuclease n=1 Tax=Hoeflea poritis TaxID=2993659 RepID=A0ABT4VQS0_9HYPH|nr:MAE_28990/MAE_18760 family HEPN-like nuclease [Hoeflea poritis]MDA4847036.1 MAE_28990/MAE_18760 family HEPN-like nuclease [Hoeflea poritis]